MNPSIRKKITSFALIFVLFCGTAIPIFADGGAALTPVAAPKVSEVVAAITPVGSVAINKKSNFELKQVAMLAGDEDKTVTFTVTVNNGEDTELEFLDYWVRLTNTTGAKYTINLMPDDKDKNRIAPHSSLDFQFYAKVNSKTALKDLKFSFIQWDFSLSNYERKLGEISIPATYTDLTPIQVKRIIPVLGTSLKTGVTRVAINKTDENYLVTVYYTLENIGLKSVKLPNLSFDLYTAEGYIYPLEATGLKDLTLAPRVKKEVQLTATIPVGIAAKDWKLLVTKEDPTVKSLPVALYALPQSSDVNTGSGEESKRVIDVAGIAVNTMINRASMAKTETSYISNIFFSFENNGAKAVLLPDYLFNVKTKEGLIYPLTAAGFTKISLNPKESKEFQLSVSIPVTVNVEGLELQLVQPSATGTDSSFNYPFATYKVPVSTAQEVSIGTEYPYMNTNGSYAAQLVSIQRLPWEDQDILSAEITIGNKGTAIAPPPKLQGYYLLDGKIKVEANLLDMDKVISIPANGKVSYVLMSKIPYTSQFSNLKLVVEEKKSDTENVALAEFRGNADLMTLPTVDKGKTYKLLNTGKSAELTITNLYTYRGTTDDLYYMELDLKNLEKRLTTATPLSAYLKTKDDLYFPATVSNVTGKINPGGKAVLAVTAELPQGLKGADLDLMIGQAVTSGTGTTASTDGYIRVAKMVLPDENTTVKSTLDGLVISPYTIGLSNFKSMDGPTSSDFSINFDYTLAKSANSSFDPATNIHQLVVEITDGLSNVHSVTYPLDVAVADATKGLGLKLGSGSLKVPIQFTSENEGIKFMNSFSNSKSYLIKIYDEYKEGYRRLLATSSGSWFPTN
ncbi:MAG: hypothetical protein WD469_06000 [Paenibacillaceae bacterium]